MKTMKKTYKNPELEVITIQAQQMIASSPIAIGEGDKRPIIADSRFLDDDFVSGM